VGADRHFVFRQKMLGEGGSVRWGVVMVKQSGLFSPKFGATSSHVFMQSPQNFAVEPGVHSLACWDRCFALPQLLYRWRYQSGIFCIPPRISAACIERILVKFDIGYCMVIVEKCHIWLKSVKNFTYCNNGRRVT
jgi:hypothetical protein